MKTVRIVTHVMEDDKVLEEQSITIPLYSTVRADRPGDDIMPSVLDPVDVAAREALRNPPIVAEVIKPYWYKRIFGRG